MPSETRTSIPLTISPVSSASFRRVSFQRLLPLPAAVTVYTPFFFAFDEVSFLTSTE